MKKVAAGIFMWNSPERRTGRYGYFFAANSTFDENYQTPIYFDSKLAEELQGKRVKIQVLVKETRPSGHAGDAFLNLKPVTPEVGEEIILGVGTFTIMKDNASPTGIAIGLKPSDRRHENWIDPRNFYRLHDQTVEIYIEETNEPETLAPVLSVRADTGAILNEDGSFQVRTKKDTTGVWIKPNVISHGGGLFQFTPIGAGKPGELFEVDLQRGDPDAN